MGKIILTIINKNKLTISLLIILIISITMNIVFYSNSTINLKKIEKNDKKIYELEMKVKEGDGKLKEINIQREAVKKEIDSLTGIINSYEEEKLKRKTKNNEKIKKINNLDANQSLDNFINWADVK